MAQETVQFVKPSFWPPAERKVKVWESTVKLKGSCHCQSVKFSLSSRQPYPFNRCYCSICRKTAGGGGLRY
ncbi:GFA family protein [Microbulbifer sp. JMSA003]|uniref:GFA family protein n=1 Tax=Microbulbifer sp. JMSA003 TaxID=3243369 RepID=UPI004039855D